MSEKNVISTLGEYVKEVFDVNKDGTIDLKDILSMFPNSAVAIAVIVIDLLVLVAEYRVWDVAYTITGGDVFKSLGFVAVSALPFYLGQVLWLYPRANWFQRLIAGGLVVVSLYTSAQFGLADLSKEYNIAGIVQMVVSLTAGYIVALILYVINDKGIKARRLLTVTQDAAEFEKTIQGITQEVLQTLEETMQREQQLKDRYSPEAVQIHLNRLRGKKPVKQEKPIQQPRLAPQNQDVEMQELKQEREPKESPTNGGKG